MMRSGRARSAPDRRSFGTHRATLGRNDRQRDIDFERDRRERFVIQVATASQHQRSRFLERLEHDGFSPARLDEIDKAEYEQRRQYGASPSSARS